MENNQTAFILFNTGDEKISADVRFEEETVWLSQEQMAALFERDRSVIVKHLAELMTCCAGSPHQKAGVSNHGQMFQR